jgi:hypothetical protein
MRKELDLRLKPLYRVEYFYTDEWGVNIEGSNSTESQYYFLSEGSCTGVLTGRFRGANRPHRRTDHTYLPDVQGVAVTDDGASTYFDYQGYARAYPVGRRQIVRAVWHLSDDPRCRWLNDALCVGVGEVRAVPAGQPHPLTGVAHEETHLPLCLMSLNLFGSRCPTPIQDRVRRSAPPHMNRDDRLRRYRRSVPCSSMRFYNAELFGPYPAVHFH